MAFLLQHTTPASSDKISVTVLSCSCGGHLPGEDDDEERYGISPSVVEPSEQVLAEREPEPTIRPSHIGQVEASHAVPGGSGLVYAFGTLGFDFASEARRDTFKQLMPAVSIGGVALPANPHDARQMVDYLGQHLAEARELVWTLNLELTPIYAFRAAGPFAREVYEAFVQLLDGQVLAEDEDDFIERVSIPGRLTGQTVQLFSGQRVPLVAVENTRGIYGWKVNSLVDAAIEAVRTEAGDVDEEAARKSLTSFLNRVYYDLRNLGQTAQERAINFAATNAFQVAATFSEAVGAGMELDDIQVVKSPFCRMDSECWDVVLSFFDAENLMRARKLFRFTIDVSDTIPVTLGKVRSWSRR